MNLALQGTIFLILLLPGVLHRYAFSKRPVKDMFENYQSSVIEALWVFFAALILYVIWLVVSQGASVVTGAEFKLEALLYFLSGNYSDLASYKSAVASFVSFKWHVLLYFVSLCVFSAYSGYWLNNFIRRRGLDIKYPVLRFNDSWDTLFSGELYFQDVVADGAPDAVNAGTAVSTIIDTADGAYLFVGILYAYFFDHRGNLDRIVLANAFRRKLSADRTPADTLLVNTSEGVTLNTDIEVEKPNPSQTIDNRYYEIDGNFVVLKYAEMKTLNLKYLLVSAET